MALDRVAKIIKTIEKNEEYSSFYDSVYGLDTEGLKQNVLIYAKYLQETLTALKNNTDIRDAEDRKAEAERPYKEKIKDAEEKIKQLKKFVDQSICKEDLEKQIVIYSRQLENERTKMSRCPRVSMIKEEINLLKGPYNDTKKVLETKIAYLNILINQNEGYEPGISDAEEIKEA